MTTTDNYLYSPNVLDLVRVSTEFCRCVEQCGEQSFADFSRTMRCLLPMIYLKMTLLGEVPEGIGWNDHKLTEDDYNFVRANVATAMADKDDFLDVFVEDFKYSDQPVLSTVSENLADVYQQLRELVETFRGGYEDAMAVALSETAEEFRAGWGQKLLGALRAIHDAAVV